MTGPTDPGRDTTASDATAEVVVTFSHELRSPLASLRGFTHLLLDRWDRLDDHDRRELLEQIDHDAARLGRLVDELLDVSRLANGRFALWCRPFDVGALAERVVRHVQAAHPTLRCRVERPHAPVEVVADPDKIEQVLVNLLENGVKYATADRMTLRIAPVARAVEICVDDEGPGLPEAERERVFDRFSRRTGRPSGLGLGLWIAREIADAHGGSLRAEGNARGGSTFRLTVPTPSPTD
jgi:signal transduction histidine kinase